jgi:hypothetical protein
VRTSDRADRQAVQAGHEQGAVGTALDDAVALGEGLGQVGLLHSPDPNARGGVAINELLSAGVGDDATPADDEQVICGLSHLAHEMA